MSGGDPMAQRMMVDRNGMRFGAGLSAAVLVLGFSMDLDIVVPIVGVALAIGALAGPAWSPMSLIFKALRASVLRGMKPEPEPAAPPRFAQTLGAFVLAAATLALYVYEAEGFGWGLALVVSVLQALLATTGLCIGCEIYLFMKRLQAKGT
jgi:hypothetical protein